MLGNGVCNIQCYSEDCGWDDGDCGCADNCTQTEYGSCKPACLVPDCNYDALPGEAQCGNEMVRTAAKYYQLATGNFSSPFSYDTICAPKAANCDSSPWQQSYISCITGCDSLSCVFSFGNCESDCSSLHHCASCAQEVCLKCQPGYVNFYGNCMAACPVGFLIHPLVDDICTPMDDFSTQENPMLIYVQSDANSAGSGSFDNPFDSLSLALAAVHMKYTTIYLFSGQHNLTLESNSRYMRRLSSSTSANTSFLPYNLTISAWTCPNDPTNPNCPATNPTLIYDNLHPIVWTIYSNFTLIGVDLIGKTGLISGCAADMCTYCPVVAMSVGGSGTSDKGVKMSPGSFSPPGTCDKFHYKGLFWLYKGVSFSIINSHISDFRQEFSSLVNMTTAYVLLQNVSISNVVLSGFAHTATNSVTTIEAMLCQYNPSQILYIPGYIRLIDVSVRLLGNGFEYNSGLIQGGLLNIEGIETIFISKVTVFMSIVQANLLVNIGNFSQLQMTNLVFDTVFTSLAMIKIAPLVKLSETYLVNNQPYDYYTDHLILSNVTFTHCSSYQINSRSGSLLSISFTGAVYSMRLEGVSITESYSDGSFVSVGNAGGLLESDKSDMKSGVVLSDGDRVHYVLPKKWVLVRDVQVVGSVGTGEDLIYFGALPNVEISQVDVRDSGDPRDVETVNTKTVALFQQNPEMYLSLSLDIPQVWHCSKMFSMSSLYNVSLSDSVFDNNACLSTVNTGGIYTSGLEGTFQATNISCHMVNSTSAELPCCLYLDTTGDITVSNLTLESCSTEDSGGVVITRSGTGGIDINDCRFERNTAHAALVQVLSAYELRADNWVMTHNRSPGTIGIYFLPQHDITSVSVSITRMTITDNTGSLISLSNIEDNPIPVLLTFTSMSFLRNRGSAISLDSANALSPGSSISNCEFKNNTAYSSIILLSFQNGEIRITNCTFAANTVTTGGAISMSLLTDGLLKQVSIDTCLFLSNRGFSVLHYQSETTTAHVATTDNYYEDNHAYAIYVSGGVLTDLNSTFLRTNSSAVFIDGPSQCNFTLAKFYQGSMVKGGLYLDGESVTYLTNCEFVNNTASEYGAAIYGEHHSQVLGTGLKFSRNTAHLRGSAIYLFGTQAQSSLSNSIFEYNSCDEGGTIATLMGVLTLSNSVIHQNSASFASGFLCYFSSIIIQNCRFSDQTSTTGSFIYGAMESNIEVFGSYFGNGTAEVEGGAVYILSAAVSVTDSEFRNVYAGHGAMISAAARSNFTIKNTRVWEMGAIRDLGGVIYSVESSGYVDRSVFEEYSNGAIVGYQQLVLSLTNTTFHSKRYIDGTARKGAGLRCTECQRLSITNSQFTSLTGNSGVAIYATTASETAISTPVTITHSLFHNITGTESGAVVITNLNAVISHSAFTTCQATDSTVGYGGALGLICDGAATPCEVIITNCRFEGNKAGRQGGSICWTNFQPLITDTVFLYGEAYYGPDIASFPLELRLMSIIGSGTVSSPTPISGIPVQGTLFDLASGQVTSQYLQLALLDHYNQTVVTDSTSTAILLPSADANIIGIISATASQGTYAFKDFGITAVPENSTLLYIQTSGIDQSVSRNFTELMTFVPTIAVRAEMRACLIGETLLNNQCVVCPAGKYSLDPSQSCLECPDGAVCYGNFTMVPKKGYWRSNQLSPEFWECPYEDSCLGSPEPPQPLNLIGKCAEGYFGNLCNGCTSGFSRQSSSECAKCPPLYQNSIRITGIAVGIFIALIIIIRTAINSAKKPRSYYSIFIKILLNYIQLVMLTASFQLQWPNYAKELFKVQQSAGSATEQVFSVDCFLDNSQEDTQARTVRTKLIMLALLPALLLAVSVVVWIPFALILRKYNYLKNELCTTMVILFFVIHPSLVKFMFDYFNCRALDGGQLWMSSYLNIPCWDSTYSKYAWIVALPSIVGWGLGVPALCLLLLWKRKRMLDLTEMKIRFGFLYNGYEYTKFYWEFVILYRKIAIISISVFLTNISTSIQALTALIVLLAAFALQSKHQPFVVPTMNKLELRAILVAAVTIYCGLYYVTKDLGGSSQVILFIIIAVVNGYFILYWLVMVCKAGILAITRRFPFLHKLLSKGGYRIQPNIVPGGLDISSATRKIGDSSSVDVSHVTFT